MTLDKNTRHTSSYPAKAFVWVSAKRKEKQNRRNSERRKKRPACREKNRNIEPCVCFLSCFFLLLSFFIWFAFNFFLFLRRFLGSLPRCLSHLIFFLPPAFALSFYPSLPSLLWVCLLSLARRSSPIPNHPFGRDGIDRFHAGWMLGLRTARLLQLASTHTRAITWQNVSVDIQQTADDLRKKRFLFRLPFLFCLFFFFRARCVVLLSFVPHWTRTHAEKVTMYSDESKLIAIISSVSSSTEQQKRSCIWSLWHLVAPVVAPLFPREFSKSISPRQRNNQLTTSTTTDRRGSLRSTICTNLTSILFCFSSSIFSIQEKSDNHLESSGDITDLAVQLVRGAKPPLCCSRNNWKKLSLLALLMECQ